MIVYGLDDKYDKNSVGGKGYGLFKLVEYGFDVPDFFVIEAGTDLTSQDFLSELDEYAQKLNCDLFSVRSSGVSEDGANASFAGQFRSELNVKRADLAQAILRVNASVYDKSVNEYSKRLQGVSKNIAVIVQKQINSIESGVMFSSDPQGGDAVLIERTQGCGDSLVSGRVVPKTQRYGKNDEACGYDSQLIEAAKLLETREGGPVDVEWAYDGKLWFLQLRMQTVLSDVIPDVPDRRWSMYVFRDFSVFSHSVQARASLSEVQRGVFGFNIPITEGLLICGREFYSEQNDAVANDVWAELDNGDFFDVFLKRIESEVRRVRRRTSEIKRRDYSDYSDKRLFAAYKTEIASYVRSYVPMMMRPDDYLQTCLVSLVGEQFASSYIDAIKALLPPTDYSRERARFLKAVAASNAKSYVDCYEWKNNPLGKRITPVSEKEFSARAQSLTPQRADELLKENRLNKRKDKACARQMLSRACGEVLRLVNLIKKFTYYRTRTAETSDRYFYYVRKNLLGEIAKRLGTDDETLMLYRIDEMGNLFNGVRLSDTELIKRKNGEAIIFSGDVIKTFFGANAYSLLKKLLPAPKDVKAVRGEVACGGEVTGIVKVIEGFADAESCDSGYILVTSMTTPDLTLSMEKAIGIITDEGGITCHAAIIAREYAVPCLVGTKVATQVLRDGMKVRLDCVNGCFTIED